MKILYDTETQTLIRYPRSDDEPVVGLDPRYLVLDLTEQEKPSHDPATHYLNRTEAIDLDALQVIHGWQLVAHEPIINCQGVSPKARKLRSICSAIFTE